MAPGTHRTPMQIEEAGGQLFALQACLSAGGGYVRRRLPPAAVEAASRDCSRRCLRRGEKHCRVQAMRLFVGDPVWTPINRAESADGHPSRAAYLKSITV